MCVMGHVYVDGWVCPIEYVCECGGGVMSVCV